MNYLKKIRCFVGPLLLLMLGGTAWGGLFEDEEARRAILDLRQQVESLQHDSEDKIAAESRRSTQEGLQLRRSLIELQNQIEALRTELAKLRGQDEQTAKELAELQRRQKDVLQATDDRLRKLEPIAVAIDGSEFLADPGEKRDFEAALALVRKGEFSKAKVALTDFLSRYPQTGYRPTVFFWLGNTNYANKNYQEAVLNFRALLTRAPGHMRVPEAMLAIADCQMEMKESKAARKTLEEIVSKYPSSEAAVTAKARLSRLK